MRSYVAGTLLSVLVGLSGQVQAAQPVAPPMPPEIDGGGGAPRASVEAELSTRAELADIASTFGQLKKTYFKTVNDDFLSLTTTWVNAFSDTVVTCPGGTCAIATTVTSQFGRIDPNQVARVRVLVNGVIAPPGDDCCLNISRNAGVLPQTNGMTFVTTGVPVGHRTVQVQFALSGGTTGYADYRTLEIRV